jgi:N-acetylmuramoyl-L-alanine amidase
MKHLVREVFFMWTEITLKLRDGMFWLQLVRALIIFALFFWLVEADASEYGWGSRGDAVRQIQQKLRQYGYMTSAADGVFGKDTYDAVVWFQKKNGLRVDGIVGKSTAAALGLSLSGTVSAAAYNESETYMLARLVHGEARGEPYVGKVAVAAVVLNRVKSPLFPNTISGVIFQAGAFDAVSDGQYNLTPDADSIRAAKDALGGWDPSGGCLYYYNPVTSTNEWIWTRTVQLSIGKHNFAI